MTMKIKLEQISVRDVVDGYFESDDDVFGYNWTLNIRPSYQRNFVYKDKERNAVINTIMKHFPLNVMYWSKNSDNTFEMLDWQQRTISFCQYVQGDFSVGEKYFHSLTNEEQETFLDYKLSIYICEWTEREKLDWFEVINIAWKPLTKQELRNAIYHWPFVSDAKTKFSKRNCPAYGLAKDYLNGSCDRQDYLETAISWLTKWEIEEYMSEHQKDENANPLWTYFQNVIDRIMIVFINQSAERKKLMNWLDWGKLYDKYWSQTFNKEKKEALEIEIGNLIKDKEVQDKKGIYPYVLTGDERNLNLRTFDEDIKQEKYAEQNWICAKCGEHFDLSEMEADHITPRSQGGKTNAENCQMLCRECNRRKSDK